MTGKAKLPILYGKYLGADMTSSRERGFEPGSIVVNLAKEEIL